MSDYKIQIGTELDTKGIDTGINKYHQKKSIEFKSKLDTSGIDKKLASYKAKKPIEVNAKLNTSGLAKKIGEYKPKTPIKLNAELDTKNIDAAIKSYKAKKSIEVNVKLNHSAISEQIRNYKPKASIKLNTRLDNNEISNQIKNYQAKTPIKLSVKLTTKDIDEKIRNYKAKTPIKLDVKINKGVINEQIKSFNPKNTIKLKAALQKGVIAEEIRKFKPSTPIKVDLELDYSDIETKVKAFANNSIELPVKLKPAKNFGGEITKASIKVNAELNPESIKTISGQLTGLQPESPIIVRAQLDDKAIDKAISDYQTTTPTIRVNVKLNDNDIDKDVKGQTTQSPIQVNVKLDRKSINEQIKTFNTKTKIKVGIKLDSKGIAEQIKKIEPKTKIKVGIEIDRNSINQEISQINVDTPLKLNVELNEDNVWSQIDNIKQKLQELGNIRIDLGAGNSVQDEIVNKSEDTNSTNNISSVSDVVQGFKEADIAIKATKNQITNLGKALKAVGFNNSAIESITNDFRNLGVTVTNVTSRLNADGSVKLTVKGLDQFKDVVTYVNNVGSDGRLGSWSETVSRDINKVTENFNRLKSLAKDIGNLKIDIFKSDDANEVKRMTDELNRLQKEYDELFVGTQGGLKSGQINQLNNIAKQAEIALSSLKKEYAETRAEFAKEIRGNFSGYDAQVKSLEGKMQRLSNVSVEVNTGIENVKQALIDMRSASDDNSLIEAEQRYQDALKETAAQLLINQSIEQRENYEDNFTAKKEAAMQRLNGLFENGSQAAKKFGSRAEELRNELNQVGNIKGVDIVNEKIKNLGKEIKNSNLQTKTFSTGLKEQFARYRNYISIASVFMYVTQAMRSMFEQVKLIDSAMTELKKVTNETDASYNKFLENAASRAKELGTTIDGLVSSTADFARLGYGFEDSQKLAEVANIYAVVGDEIEGVEDATQSLVSTMAAFKGEMNGMDDGDFAMGIVDKMNEVSNNFAISSGGIGQALQRSASSMAAANNTLDETIAMITAANEVAQNPEKVGKWLCRLKKWLYRLKTRDGSDRGKTL